MAPVLPAVSVLLVTKNGERYLAEVLQQLHAQRGAFELVEIIAVDSGSRDDTLGILRRGAVKVISIAPREFGHGKTRNLAASEARGNYLVFLTQDATPVNAQWLANLVTPLEHDPTIAGAYSRHLPRPGCHPMEWRRIVEMELSGRAESHINNSAVDNAEYASNPAAFYFFSNVSSIVRRAVWERFPLPEVEFGEDQLWAKQVLAAGHRTAYCADSLVYHSHSYGPWANLQRHFDHAVAFRPAPSESRQHALRGCVRSAFQVARCDLAFWCRHDGQSKAAVLRRWGALAVSWHLAGHLGLWLGERVDVLPRRLYRSLSFQERIKGR